MPFFVVRVGLLEVNLLPASGYHGRALFFVLRPGGCDGCGARQCWALRLLFWVAVLNDRMTWANVKTTLTLKFAVRMTLEAAAFCDDEIMFARGRGTQRQDTTSSEPALMQKLSTKGDSTLHEIRPHQRRRSSVFHSLRTGKRGGCEN